MNSIVMQVLTIRFVGVGSSGSSLTCDFRKEFVAVLNTMQFKIQQKKSTHYDSEIFPICGFHRTRSTFNIFEVHMTSQEICIQFCFDTVQRCFDKSFPIICMYNIPLMSNSPYVFNESFQNVSSISLKCLCQIGSVEKLSEC